MDFQLSPDLKKTRLYKTLQTSLTSGVDRDLYRYHTVSVSRITGQIQNEPVYCSDGGARDERQNRIYTNRPVLDSGKGG